MSRYVLAAEQSISTYQAPGDHRQYREIRFDDTLTGEQITVRVYAPLDLIEDAFAWAAAALPKDEAK
jgi:hypothetical protein